MEPLFRRPISSGNQTWQWKIADTTIERNLPIFAALSVLSSSRAVRCTSFQGICLRFCAMQTDYVVITQYTKYSPSHTSPWKIRHVQVVFSDETSTVFLQNLHWTRLIGPLQRFTHLLTINSKMSWLPSCDVSMFISQGCPQATCFGRHHSWTRHRCVWCLQDFTHELKLKSKQEQSPFTHNKLRNTVASHPWLVLSYVRFMGFAMTAVLQKSRPKFSWTAKTHPINSFSQWNSLHK